MSPKRIRVLCVDDHPIVREGIAFIIERQPDMVVVASASTGDEALDLFRRHHPDVTLMDLRLGAMCGVEIIRTLHTEAPEARIIALTMYQGDEDVYRAFEAGASAYLRKETVSDDLIRVVRSVHAGESPTLTPDVKARLAARATRPALTRREHQVLELIAVGMRNREIAAALAIAEETVMIHVKNLLAKLDVRDRVAAVNVALHRGIIHVR